MITRSVMLSGDEAAVIASLATTVVQFFGLPPTDDVRDAMISACGKIDDAFGLSSVDRLVCGEEDEE